MVNSRQKGNKEELEVARILTEYSKVDWRQTPGSGNGLVKGDITCNKCLYTVEVKHTKDSEINDKILTNKSNKITIWWNKLVRESRQMKKLPLLIVKYNYSKRFAIFQHPQPISSFNSIKVNSLGFYIMELTEWLEKEQPKLNT